MDAALVVTSDLAIIAGRRAGLAALLGCLLLEEPGPGVADLVRDVPALASLGRGDPSVASEYERVFLRGVPLHESVFTNDDGQQGGQALTRLVERYAEIGFDEHRLGSWRVAGADHLGLELRCYAQLCRDEARAWSDRTPDLAAKTVEAERSFLADHLMAWAAVALGAATSVAGEGPYAPVVGAALEFLTEEAARLRPAPDVGEPLPVARLPEFVGPARLARLLLAPASCGGWLDTVDIARAAAAVGVPWRPSDTRSALRHVVEAAVESGDLAGLTGVLAEVVEGFRSAHETRIRTEPGNGAHWRRWEERAASMEALLRDVAERGTLATARVDVAETLRISGADAATVADAVDRVVAELRAAGLEVQRTPGR